MRANFERFLIVNADDFGLSPGVNRGIIKSHTQGIVTSTSLMVRASAAQEAAGLSRAHPDLGVGLHVDMGEWVYLDSEWKSKYQVVPEGATAEEIQAEVLRQLKLFRVIMKCEPTHLDSHQHAHLKYPLHDILRSLSSALHVPLRHHTPGVQYCGAFYGQSETSAPFHALVGEENLCRILQNLPAGVTELACHPGLEADSDSAYSIERGLEVTSLCSSVVREVIASSGIRLCSFRNMPLRPRIG
jgi:chitin disaccharide deacetylase